MHVQSRAVTTTGGRRQTHRSITFHVKHDLRDWEEGGTPEVTLSAPYLHPLLKAQIALRRPRHSSPGRPGVTS